MGIDKTYHGYKAFSYVKAGKDYEPVPLPEKGDQIFPWHIYPLNPDQEARYKELAESTIMISSHEHASLWPNDIPTYGDKYFGQGRTFIDYESLSHSIWDGVFNTINTSHPTSKKGRKFDDIVYELGFTLCDIAQQDDVILCLKADDVIRAHKEHKVALSMHIECGDWIENEEDRVEVLYGLGLRSFGLSYANSNCICSGIRERRDGGLTELGRKVVAKMNAVGMIVDTAHTSVNSKMDIIEASTKPVMLSHCGAQALIPESITSTPDFVFKAMADKGGVIGVTACPNSLVSKKHPKCDIEAVMEHFEHVRNLVGDDCVCFGLDTIYTDHAAMHTASGHPGPDWKYEWTPYCSGLENASEGSINILRWLIAHDYSDETIKKVCGGNMLRLMRECWG
ncbi:MAG: membrane dipeptidase [Firmicutes bacterium]|nr:membrane dipeptidase [Bacillota bacterium]